MWYWGTLTNYYPECFNCDFVFFIVFVVNSVSLILSRYHKAPRMFYDLRCHHFAPVLDWGKRLKYSNSPELISWTINALKFPAFLILLLVTSQPFNVSRHRFPRNMNQMRMYFPRISTPVGNLDISWVFDKLIYLRMVVPDNPSLAVWLT